MLRIRPFEWSDVESINKLMNDPDIARCGPGIIPTPLESTVHMIAERFKYNGVIFVAEEDNEFLGTLFLGVGKDRLSHIGTIGVFVKKEQWGKGIATKLVEECIKSAKKMGLKKLVYEVYSHNERSINLVKKFGFELNGTQKRHLLVDGQYVDKLIFEKLL